MGESPFIKVEATQFTEIGYHGKDVDNIVNELTGLTIRKYRENINDISDHLASEMAELVDLFILDFLIGEDNLDEETREYKYDNLRKGLYDDFQVTIELPRDLDEKRFNNVEEYLDDLTLLRKCVAS
jgi:ATP-dependent HslUV protease ATP-binding subunit HslU